MRTLTSRDEYRLTSISEDFATAEYRYDDHLRDSMLSVTTTTICTGGCNLIQTK